MLSRDHDPKNACAGLIEVLLLPVLRREGRLGIRVGLELERRVERVLEFLLKGLVRSTRFSSECSIVLPSGIV